MFSISLSPDQPLDIRVPALHQGRGPGPEPDRRRYRGGWLYYLLFIVLMYAYYAMILIIDRCRYRGVCAETFMLYNLMIVLNIWHLGSTIF